MAGGVFAGVLGPQLVQWTMDIWPPYMFAFSFAMQALVALVAMAILAGVDAPKPAPTDLHGGRPLFEIARQPRFIAAALCGVIAYPMMNLVMTSAPLAMKRGCRAISNRGRPPCKSVGAGFGASTPARIAIATSDQCLHRKGKGERYRACGPTARRTRRPPWPDTALH